MSFPKEPVIGPMLAELLAAQRRDEQAVSYPRLRDLAAELVGRCEDLNDPLVWPIDDVGQRLAGAAVLLSEGGVRVRGWGDGSREKRVLLLAGTTVTAAPLLRAAAHARAFGVDEIHACVLGLADDPVVGDGLASCSVLRASRVDELLPA